MSNCHIQLVYKFHLKKPHYEKPHTRTTKYKIILEFQLFINYKKPCNYLTSASSLKRAIFLNICTTKNGGIGTSVIFLALVEEKNCKFFKADEERHMNVVKISNANI